MRFTPEGRPYFVNHLARSTQFQDPRLPAPTQSTVPPADDDSDLPQYKRDIKQKLARLHERLPQREGHVDIRVSRKSVLEDSYRVVSALTVDDLKKRLNIRFEGEDGLDYGGVAREWFYLISHEMLNPYYGLFQYSREDIYTLVINPDSYVNPGHLDYFHFIGRLIGMAIYHGHYIDGGFAAPMYKLMLGKQVDIDDLESTYAPRPQMRPVVPRPLTLPPRAGCLVLQRSGLSS